MPKRVSLKGKGADIFFGDYSPASTPTNTNTNADRDPNASVASDAFAAATTPSASTTPDARTSPAPVAMPVDVPVALASTKEREVDAQNNQEDAKQESKKASLLARKDASSKESKQERMQAPKKASKNSIEATNQTNQAHSPIGPLATDVLNAILIYVSERATVTNAFRYTDQELSWLTDALYEINKRHGVKLTKQDIARLGLNAILWDYRVRGDDSLLGEFAIKRRRRGGKEL